MNFYAAETKEVKLDDILILSAVAIVSSFIATFGIASRLKRVEPVTEIEKLRIQLDSELDQLRAAELRELLRLCRELGERQNAEESACHPGPAAAQLRSTH